MTLSFQSLSELYRMSHSARPALEHQTGGRIAPIAKHAIGYRRKAIRYFNFAAVMDLSDVGGNMMHGVHIASSAARGWLWSTALPACVTMAGMSYSGRAFPTSGRGSRSR